MYYAQITFISMFSIRSILGLYLEVQWYFHDQKYALGTELLFISPPWWTGEAAKIMFQSS